MHKIVKFLIFSICSIINCAEIGTVNVIDQLNSLFREFLNTKNDITIKMHKLQKQLTAGTVVKPKSFEMLKIAQTKPTVTNLVIAFQQRFQAKKDDVAKLFMKLIEIINSLKKIASNPDDVKKYDDFIRETMPGLGMKLFEGIDKLIESLKPILDFLHTMNILPDFKYKDLPPIPTEKNIFQPMDEETIRILLQAGGQIIPD